MNLAELQRTMAEGLMRPLRETPEASYIKPNPLLSSRERLGIYHRQYWYRLIDSLHEDFPGLRAVVGVRAFDKLMEAYLAECPSQSFTLRDLGSRLEGWLRRNPACAGSRLAPALDMVRLEWAHIVAFDGPSRDVLGPEDLLEPGPDLHIGVQPYVGLLDVDYPVDEIRIRVNAQSAEHNAASNAAAEKKNRSALRSAVPRKPRRLYIAVHRWDFTVYYRRLAADEFRLLTALRNGCSVADAIDTAFAGTRLDAAEIQQALASGFRAWAELGWLCRVS